MMATIIHCLAYTAVLAALWNLGQATEVRINMDKDESPKCEEVVVLQPGHEVRLTAKGLVPNGYCGVSVFTPQTVDNYTCDALCVTFKTASISTCQMKLKFVGHTFAASGDYTKEFNCHDLSRSSFCWPVSSMRVEVIEKYEYAYVEQRRLYEFDVDINARCTKNLLKSTKEIMAAASKEKMREQEHKTYVEGIAVGVSLACVFLIVLLAAWCYTKHQAVASSPSDNPPHTGPKRSIIAMGQRLRRSLRWSRKSEAAPETV